MATDQADDAARFAADAAEQDARATNGGLMGEYVSAHTATDEAERAIESAAEAELYGP